MSVMLQEWEKHQPPRGSRKWQWWRKREFRCWSWKRKRKIVCLPNKGCIKTYQGYGSMINHTLYGQCVFQSERESVMDTAKVLYCKKLLGENNALMVTTETAAKSSSPSPHNVLDEGWALKLTKTSKPFSENRGISSRKNDSQSVRRQGENLSPCL